MSLDVCPSFPMLVTEQQTLVKNKLSLIKIAKKKFYMVKIVEGKREVQ
jgi:hypothetical protein